MQVRPKLTPTCGATYWIDGAPQACRVATTSPSRPYCRECWEVLSYEFDDLAEFPPRDDQRREIRYCIGETTLFPLSAKQWRDLERRMKAPARRSEAILIEVPAPRPHWAKADARTGGECSVYVLQLKDGGFYVGHTGKTVELRVEQHRAGAVVMTRGRGVKDCVFTQPVTSRALAQQLEKSIASLLTQLGFRVDSY